MNESQAEGGGKKLSSPGSQITLLALIVAVVLALWALAFHCAAGLQLANRHSSLRGRPHPAHRVTTGDEIASSPRLQRHGREPRENVIRLLRSQAQLKAVAEEVGSALPDVIERVDEQRGIIDDTYHSIDKLNSGVRKITDNVEALSRRLRRPPPRCWRWWHRWKRSHAIRRRCSTLSRRPPRRRIRWCPRSTSRPEVVYLTNFVTDTSSSWWRCGLHRAGGRRNAAGVRRWPFPWPTPPGGMRAGAGDDRRDGADSRSVAESNAVVSRLGDRSVAIGKILNVIEDVAEQTNLLALKCRDPRRAGGRAMGKASRSWPPRSASSRADGVLAARDRHPDHRVQSEVVNASRTCRPDPSSSKTE